MPTHTRGELKKVQKRVWDLFESENYKSSVKKFLEVYLLFLSEKTGLLLKIKGGQN